MAFRPIGVFRIGPSDSVLWSRPNSIDIGSEITLRVTQQASVCLCETYWSDVIWLDFQCLCCDGTWRTWTWRRLLAIIQTRKSIVRLHGSVHRSQVSVHIVNRKQLTNQNSAAMNQRGRLSWPKMHFQSLRSIKILQLLFAQRVQIFIHWWKRNFSFHELQS